EDVVAPSVREISVPLLASQCSGGFKISRPGVRKDGKKFAAAVGATFRVQLTDPRNNDFRYTVDIKEAFLLSAPAADQEPSGSAVAIKVYPTLEVSIASNNPTPPSFAADLKMIFAPRLTRPDQHRPDSQFVPNLGEPDPRDTNVVSLFCDTNNLARPVPGAGFPPTPPFWSYVFDYAEPNLVFETAIDAVVFPRSAAKPDLFTIKVLSLQGVPIGGILQGSLSCQRLPG